MPRKIVDLSIYLENDVVSDPPPFGPKITYLDHQATFPQMAPFFPGLKQEDLPDGAAWAVEKVELITHNGTHLDAPYHFHPTMNAASGQPERVIAIDEVSLDWCFQPGVKLDFRHFPDDYVSAGCGMGYEATLYLLERGVRLTGTDAWSWDAPFVHTAEKYQATQDASLIWEGHKAGRDIGYCHLEKLHNLEAVPAHGFVVACFPHKIRGASAGWTRAVAIFDELLLESFRREGAEPARATR